MLLLTAKKIAGGSGAGGMDDGRGSRRLQSPFLILPLPLFSSACFAAAQPGGDPGELDGAAHHVGLAAVRTLELGDAQLQDRIQVSAEATGKWIKSLKSQITLHRADCCKLCCFPCFETT